MKRPPPGADAPSSRMKQRVHSNLQGEFIPARWPGHNASGLTPRGDNVLVRMDQMAPKTAGGIILPGSAVEAQNAASETGCIFATGPLAEAVAGGKIEVGQRVYIEKYAGIVALGRDGLMYRIMKESCVGAVIDFGYSDDESFGEESGVMASLPSDYANAANSKLDPQHRPTMTALLSRIGVALNCAEDESRTLTNLIVHGYGPAPPNNRPELVECEPDNLLARLEAYVERAEGLHKALA